MALVERSMTENTGVLRLNREDKHNSLNGDLMREMMAGLDELVEQGARVVIINPDTTDLDPVADVCLREPAAQCLPLLLELP